MIILGISEPWRCSLKVEKLIFSPSFCFLWNKSAFLLNTACSNLMLLIVSADKCVLGKCWPCVCASTCMCVSMAFFQRHLLIARNPGACFQWGNPIPPSLSTRRLNLVEIVTSLDSSKYWCVHKCHPVSRP